MKNKPFIQINNSKKKLSSKPFANYFYWTILARPSTKCFKYLRHNFLKVILIEKKNSWTSPKSRNKNNNWLRSFYENTPTTWAFYMAWHTDRHVNKCSFIWQILQCHQTRVSLFILLWVFFFCFSYIISFH